MGSLQRARAGRATVAVALLAVATACSGGGQPSVPDYTGAPTAGTTGSSTSVTTPAATATSTATSTVPSAITTTDPGTETAFDLPAGMDGSTTRMVQTYVTWEIAYRRSMAAAQLDPGVSQLGTGRAVSVATTTVSYLQEHHGTLVGPWRLTVSDARAGARVGVLRLCIAGGSQIFDGKKSGFTTGTTETVTLNDAGLGWRVTNYDEGKQACA